MNSYFAESPFDLHVVGLETQSRHFDAFLAGPGDAMGTGSSASEHVVEIRVESPEVEVPGALFGRLETLTAFACTRAGKKPSYWAS